jgi:hypothetical protein
MWSLPGIPALVLKDFNKSPGIVSLLVDSIRTSCGVHLEFGRILWQHTVAATLREVLMESIRIRGSV